MDNCFDTYKSLLKEFDEKSPIAIVMTSPDEEIIKGILMANKGELSEKEINELISDIDKKFFKDYPAIYHYSYYEGLLQNTNIPKSCAMRMITKPHYNTSIFQRDDLILDDIESIYISLGKDIFQEVFIDRKILPSTNAIDVACNLPIEILEKIDFAPFHQIKQGCKILTELNDFIKKYGDNEKFISALISNEYLSSAYRNKLSNTYPNDPTKITNGTSQIIDELYVSASESIFGSDDPQEGGKETMKNLIRGGQLASFHIYDLVNSINKNKGNVGLNDDIDKMIKKSKSATILEKFIDLKYLRHKETVTRNPYIVMSIFPKAKDVISSKYQPERERKQLFLNTIYDLPDKKHFFNISIYKEELLQTPIDPMFIKATLISPMVPAQEIETLFYTTLLPEMKDKKLKEEIIFLLDLKKEMEGTLSPIQQQNLLYELVKRHEEQKDPYASYEDGLYTYPTKNLLLSDIEQVFRPQHNPEFISLGQTYKIERCLNAIKTKYKNIAPENVPFLSELEKIYEMEQEKEKLINNLCAIWIYNDYKYNLDINALCDIYENGNKKQIEKLEQQILTSPYRSEFFKMLKNKINIEKSEQMILVYRYMTALEPLYKKLDKAERQIYQHNKITKESGEMCYE